MSSLDLAFHLFRDLEWIFCLFGESCCGIVIGGDDSKCLIADNVRVTTSCVTLVYLKKSLNLTLKKLHFNDDLNSGSLRSPELFRIYLTLTKSQVIPYSERQISTLE